MNKPKSVREWMAMKRQKIQKREKDFKNKFEAAPRCVQDEYNNCEAKIKKFLDARSQKERLKGFEEVLYAPQNGTLTEAQTVQLQELLRLQGWDVVQIAPLKWRGKGPRPIGLQFRHYEDD